MTVSKQQKGTYSLVLREEIEEFDTEEIALNQICDEPREVIVTKKNFPKQLIGYFTCTERVNFLQNKMKRPKERTNGRLLPISFLV